MSILFQLIEEFDLIYLFVHEHPDGDAINSRLALYHYLLYNYPNKQVISVDDEQLDIEPKSLAIVLDCGSGYRVLNKNFTKSKKSLLIDHHIHNGEPFTDHEIISTASVATAQVLADVLLKEKDKVNREIAFYLYAGLVCDSLNFTIDTVDSATMKTASDILAYGVDSLAVQTAVFGMTWNQFSFATKLRSLAQLKDKVIILKIPKSLTAEYSIDMNFAKECVREFKNVQDAQIIALFYEENHGLYNASLRSHKLRLLETAWKYKGGGHPLAVGIKNLDEEKQAALIADLVELSNQG